MPICETSSEASSSLPRSGGEARRNRRKSVARLHAIQALYQMEQTGQALYQVQREFLDCRFGETIDGQTILRADAKLFTQLLEGAVESQALIDQTIDRALVSAWPLGRVDSILRALFRAAGAEMTQKATPAKAVICEFVQIAEAFAPAGRASGFVNGVLDHMMREIRPQELPPLPPSASATAAESSG
ncbi:MAG: transcription antitermination factor NusB [Rhodobacteraceae bacterium]|nr:transcription antitermination factor NusB [Paracoccaceae bacterium]